MGHYAKLKVVASQTLNAPYMRLAHDAFAFWRLDAEYAHSICKEPITDSALAVGD
jgi:hypothetical protein